ncbi:NFkB inhibitor [Hypsugopox virus]|nr:NFkB inhibitor [Hypsugopox virus]
MKYYIFSCCLTLCLFNTYYTEFNKTSKVNNYRYWNAALVLTVELTYPIMLLENECKITIPKTSEVTVTGYGLQVKIDILNNITGDIVSVSEGVQNNNTLVIIVFIGNDKTTQENAIVPYTNITITCIEMDCSNNIFNFTNKANNNDNNANYLTIIGDCVKCVSLDSYPTSLYGYISPPGFYAFPYRYHNFNKGYENAILTNNLCAHITNATYNSCSKYSNNYFKIY